MAEILKPEVNHYQLAELIGEGLSSCVYKAIRTDSRGHSSQIVAIKLLKSHEHICLLQNEFEALCRIRSPHCVSVLGWENFNNTSALILEFVEGLSLENYLKHTFLSNDQLDELTRQIQLGLEHLRQNQLCHGDLSPSNILIDVHGVVRLVDFGLAGGPEAWRFGTPDFLAPERLDGAPPSHASDLYALGLLRQSINQCAEIGQLLHVLPSRRRALDLVGHECAAQELAQQVSHILRERSHRVKATQILDAPVARRLLPRRWLAMAASLVVGLGLSIPTVPYSDTVQKITPSSLMIRSRAWIWVSLNDRDLGFSPITLATLPPGRYRVRWRTAKAHGQFQLDLIEGEHKVMTEADFLRNSR